MSIFPLYFLLPFLQPLVTTFPQAQVVLWSCLKSCPTQKCPPNQEQGINRSGEEAWCHFFVCPDRSDLQFLMTSESSRPCLFFLSHSILPFTDHRSPPPLLHPWSRAFSTLISHPKSPLNVTKSQISSSGTPRNIICSPAYSFRRFFVCSFFFLMTSSRDRIYCGT